MAGRSKPSRVRSKQQLLLTYRDVSGVEPALNELDVLLPDQARCHVAVHDLPQREALPLPVQRVRHGLGVVLELAADAPDRRKVAELQLTNDELQIVPAQHGHQLG